MQINAGFQGNVRVGGSGASASGNASFSSPNGGSLLGNLVTSLVDKSISNLGNMGKSVAAHMGATIQLGFGVATGNMDMVGKALEQEARAGLVFFSGGRLNLLDGVSGAPCRAHTPPRPRESLAASGRVGVEGRASWNADLKARFKVDNGGYGTSADVRLTNMQDFGSIELRGKGSISVSERSTLKASLECMGRSSGGGASGNVNARVGFDIAARTAEHPLLSVLCAASSPLSLMLFASRAACQGGFAHLRAAFEFNFNMGTGDVQRPRVDGHKPADGTGETEKPKTTDGAKQPKGTNGTDPQDFLNNPNLTFEDKIFLFCMAMAKRQEDKIEGMMRKWQSMKQTGDNAGKSPGGAGEAKPAPGGEAPGGAGGVGEGMPGLPIPGMGGGGGGGGGLDVGSIVNVFKTLGPMALDLASSTAPLWVTGLSAAAAAIPGIGPLITAAGPLALPLVKGGLSSLSGLIKGGGLDGIMGSVLGAAGGGGGASGAAGGGAPGAAGGAAQPGRAPASHGSANTPAAKEPKYDNASMEEGGAEVERQITPGSKESEGQFTQLLQKEQQLLTKLFEMCTNMMKASQDSQMSSIRNMR